MKAFAATIFAASMISLGFAGSASAVSFSDLMLVLNPNDPAGNGPIQEDATGALSLKSMLGDGGVFVADLTQIWQSEVLLGGKAKFVSDFTDYLNTFPGNNITSNWADVGNSAAVFATGYNWSATFDPNAATYTLNDNPPVSLNAPGPVAGSGLLGLLAAASLAGLVMRKRAGSLG